MINRRNYLGRPYAECNCLDLALEVQADLGHVIPALVGLDPAFPSVPEDWYEHWRRVDDDNREEGTVLVVQGSPLGVGTVLNDREVLTTRPGTGALVRDLDAFLLPGLISAWRAA